MDGTVRLLLGLLGVGIFLFSLLLPLSYSRADETTEPPVVYSIDIDGKAYSVALGTPLRTEGIFTNPTITLTAASTRHFGAVGIEFNYPAAFQWEADVEVENAKSWTLSGNDLKIMVFQLSKGVTASSYGQAMVKQFGSENTTIKSTERTLGGKLLTGRILNTVIANTKITMEILEVPTKANPRFLVLQDNPPEGESASAEALSTLKMLSNTFTYKD
jgi:hypothetical protein